MRKNFVAILISLFCVAVSFSQIKREVKEQTLISEDVPKIKLKFDKKFKFAGSQKFVLYERAEAEQFFFVEAKDKKIKRMYMLQFENFLPDAKGVYDYDELQTVKIGGLDFFANAETVPNVEQVLKAAPDSDVAKAVEFLKGKGYTLMKSLIYQRFVRVVSDDKRSEFIIVYVEDTETKDAEKQKTNLQKAALANFKILK
jgi:hypothetical protein